MEFDSGRRAHYVAPWSIQMTDFPHIVTGPSSPFVARIPLRTETIAEAQQCCVHANRVTNELFRRRESRRPVTQNPSWCVWTIGILPASRAIKADKIAQWYLFFSGAISNHVLLFQEADGGTNLVREMIEQVRESLVEQIDHGVATTLFCPGVEYCFRPLYEITDSAFP